MTELEDFVGPPSVYELSDERNYNLTAADEECLTLEFLINSLNLNELSSVNDSTVVVNHMESTCILNNSVCYSSLVLNVTFKSS